MGSLQQQLYDDEKEKGEIGEAIAICSMFGKYEVIKTDSETDKAGKDMWIRPTGCFCPHETIDIKADFLSFQTGNLYLELERRYKSGKVTAGWCRSLTADYIGFIPMGYRDSDLMIVPSEILRDMIDNPVRFGLVDKTGNRGIDPHKEVGGYVLSIDALMGSFGDRIEVVNITMNQKTMTPVPRGCVGEKPRYMPSDSLRRVYPALQQKAEAITRNSKIIYERECALIECCGSPHMGDDSPRPIGRPAGARYNT